MTIDNFLTSVLSSLVTERLKNFSKQWYAREDEPAAWEIDASISKPCKNEHLKSRSFSIDFLEDFFDFIREPVLHVILESDTTSFYFTVAVIMESSITGEWYVFGIGQLAVQGMGGGSRRFEQLLDVIRKRDPSVAIWCCSNVDMTAIEEGKITWLDLKSRLIPLLSAIRNFSEFKEVLVRIKTSFPEYASIIEHP